MRLIDADALVEHMNARVVDLREMYGDYDHYTDGFDDALQVVEYAPTIDAVEVVRCKDCIFRPTTKGDMYGTDVDSLTRECVRLNAKTHIIAR